MSLPPIPRLDKVIDAQSLDNNLNAILVYLKRISDAFADTVLSSSQADIVTLLSSRILTVNGVANRISITGSTNENDAGVIGIVDIANNYRGQASIDTVGTITSGIWNGNPIDLSNYITGVLPIASFPPLPVGGSSSVVSISGLLDVQTSAIGNLTDLTDDTLFTYNLLASALSSNGKSLRSLATGHFATNAHNKQVKFWFAGNVIVASGVLTSSNIDWYSEVHITRVDSTHVSCVGIFQASGLVPIVTVTPNLLVSDLALNDSIIKITGASSTSGTANDVLGYSLRTEFMN